MGIMAPFCRFYVGVKKLVAFLSLVKNNRGQKNDPYPEEPELASASLEKDFVAVVLFCCGSLGFSRLSHGAG